jgi:hypothetical protein
MHEIAVRGVHFHDLKAGLARAPCRHCIQLERARDGFGVERRRHLIAVAE